MEKPKRGEPTNPALRFQANVLEQVNDAIIALDSEQRITYLNAAASRLYGVSVQQAIGLPLRDIVDYRWVDDAEKQTAYAALAKGGIWRGEKVHLNVRRDGISLYVEPSVSTLTDEAGHQVGFLIVIRDVSDRVHLDALQRASDDRYRAFVANSSEGIWRYELDVPLDLSLPIDAQIEHLYRHARLAELNDAMARMYGYHHASELIDASIEQMLPRHDEGAQAFLRHVATSRYCVTDLESIEADHEGRLHHFENSMVPMIVGEKLLRAWGVQRDITERKRAEEQLREEDRRKDEFLAVLAHELRNPLAPIRNGLQILRLQAGNDANVQRTVSMMDRQTTQLVRLVDDLLDISRIKHGRLDLRLQNLLLTDVIASAVEASRSLVDTQGHALIVDVKDEGLRVEGDATRLTQIFANLISNSAKYSDTGGSITIVVFRENDEAVVQVKDRGIGIPPEALDDVFEMFSQVGSKHPRSQGGLGIGLALARTLVQLHRGTIRASSEGLGKGSTFTVRLPLARSREALGGTSALVDAAGTRRLRILVVDDNADAARSLAMLLEIGGHEVQTAADGQKAVDLAREFRPQVIFMDIGMPMMDGLEASRRIRALPQCRDVRIIALTGWGQKEDRERTRDAGMEYHLTKPVSLEALRDALVRVSCP